jgi:hypothetical protein
VALSSTEAEFYAVSEAVKEILFVVQVLLDVGIPVKTPITVKVDNMGAVFMVNNATSSARTRHIDQGGILLGSSKGNWLRWSL